MNLPRTEPCACGGFIHAMPDNVAVAVDAHNWTAEHRAWRRRREAVICSWFHRRQLRRDVELVRLRRWAGAQRCQP